MNIRPITLLIKKISKQFTHGEILDWFYIGVILFLIGGIIVVSISTLVFLLRAFDAVIFVSDKEALSETAHFNITTLESIAPRFGIKINGAVAPSVQPQQKEMELLPIPTPSISLPALSGLTLHILNGTDIPGLAKTWKERFEAKGLRNVRVGNAPESDEKGIVITYKPGKEIFLEALREIIKEHENTPIHNQMDTTFSDDVVIIIGR